MEKSLQSSYRNIPDELVITLLILIQCLNKEL